MICESCLCQAHRLHYTKVGQICDDCLDEYKEYDPRSTRQISPLPSEFALGGRCSDRTMTRFLLEFLEDWGYRFGRWTSISVILCLALALHPIFLSTIRFA